MNLYDFDKTIYKKDSTLVFYWFCFKRKPIKMFGHFVYSCVLFILNKLGFITTRVFKERFLSFTRYFVKIEDEVQKFWGGGNLLK